MTQLSALQLVQMRATVATLGGIGGSGTAGTRATDEAGRNVSARVYVGTRHSSGGATQAQVQVDVSRHLKLHTTIDSGAGSAQGATTNDQAGSTVGL